MKRALPCVVLALGCKIDAPASESAASRSRPAKQAAGNGRSAKPDLVLPRDPTHGSGRRDPWDVLDPLDDNADGTVTFDEIVVDRYRRAEEMKTKFDADGDGKLTIEELAARGRTRGHMIRFRPLGDPATVDADKNGEISTDEIDAILEAR